jgi:nitric oxide reductase subunit B
MRYVRLWFGLGVVIVGSFAVLSYFGRELYRQAPPIPARVVATDGRVIYSGQDIREGQNVWQSLGGQEGGTVWGHGAYVAPDWSADYLHREATWILDRWAQDRGAKGYAELDDEARAALKGRE